MFQKPLFTVALAAAVPCWICLAAAHAKKPGKPGGSGGEGPSYDIIQLDDDWDGITFVRGEARHINEAREIVGQIEDPITGDLLAAYWTSANVLLPLNGNAISATGINDLRAIVGWGHTSGGSSTGLWWASPNANPVPLTPLSGDDESAAFRINNAGIVSGYSHRRIYGPDPRVAENPPTILLKTESRAVVWRVTNGGIQGPFELPNLMDMGLTNDPDKAYSSATNVNDNTEGTVTVVGGFMSSHEITADNPDARAVKILSRTLKSAIETGCDNRWLHISIEVASRTLRPIRTNGRWSSSTTYQSAVR